MEKTIEQVDNKKTTNKSIIVGVATGLIIIILCFVLFSVKLQISGNTVVDKNTLYFVIGIGFAIMGAPFFLKLITEGSREKNIEQMFLEFTRDLVESVRSGTPINRTIINLRGKDYGSLNPHVEKLANQISIGVPVKDALDVFAKDLKSEVISRSVGLIREAERSGGEIGAILESVAFSVSQIEKLKKERAAAIYSLTVQGYIIFFIFIIIMLVLEFKILPIAGALNIESSSSLKEIGGIFSNASSTLNPQDFAKSFLFLLISQGFFAGLIIGKISEGFVKAGLKHSFVLVLVSWLVSTGADKFLA